MLINALPGESQATTDQQITNKLYLYIYIYEKQATHFPINSEKLKKPVKDRQTGFNFRIRTRSQESGLIK